METKAGKVRKHLFPRFSHLLFLRFVALFVLITFASINLLVVPSYAADTFSPPVNRKSFPSDLSLIQLPGSMGKIQELYQAKGSEVVILVQDAHAIPDAQRSIQKIIGHFQNEYGVNLVALEGTSSELDPQIFKSFPDREKLKKTFETYFDQGELTGVTAAAIFNESPSLYHGIEDWSLYEEGLGFYLKAVNQESKIIQQLTSQKTNLEKQKQKIYSKKLLELDQVINSFHENQLTLIETLQKLSQIKAPEQETELSLLLEEAKREDQSEFSIEREVKKMSGQVKKAVFFSKSYQILFNQKYQEYQTSRMTPEAFAHFMMGLITKYDLPIKPSSHLAHLIENQKKMKEIEGTQFFKDFETYAHSVKSSLIKTEDERRLDQETRQLQLLERLHHLELTREDWKELSTLSLSATKMADPSFGGRGSVQSKAEAISEMRSLFSHHFAFYRNAQKREEVFFHNLMKLMKENDSRSTNSSILVAGGFHTEGMIKKLKENGISYILLTPQINSLPEHSFYKEHMQGGVSWKDYFEVEEGKINISKAFIRGTRDRLLNVPETSVIPERLYRESMDPSPKVFIGDLAPRLKHSGATKSVDSGMALNPDPHLLKEWRDQIIRDLAREERITELKHYTSYLDELIQRKESRPDWMIKVERFIEGLRKLDAQKQLTEPNIMKLLGPATMADLTAGAIARDTRVDLSRVPLSVELAMKASPKKLRKAGVVTKPHPKLKARAEVPLRPTGAGTSLSLPRSEARAEVRTGSKGPLNVEQLEDRTLPSTYNPLYPLSDILLAPNVGHLDESTVTQLNTSGDHGSNVQYVSPDGNYAALVSADNKVQIQRFDRPDVNVVVNLSSDYGLSGIEWTALSSGEPAAVLIGNDQSQTINLNSLPALNPVPTGNNNLIDASLLDVGSSGQSLISPYTATISVEDLSISVEGLKETYEQGETVSFKVTPVYTEPWQPSYPAFGLWYELDQENGQRRSVRIPPDQYSYNPENQTFAWNTANAVPNEYTITVQVVFGTQTGGYFHVAVYKTFTVSSPINPSPSSGPLIGSVNISGESVSEKFDRLLSAMERATGGTVFEQYTENNLFGYFKLKLPSEKIREFRVNLRGSESSSSDTYQLRSASDFFLHDFVYEVSIRYVVHDGMGTPQFMTRATGLTPKALKETFDLSELSQEQKEALFLKLVQEMVNLPFLDEGRYGEGFIQAANLPGVTVEEVHAVAFDGQFIRLDTVPFAFSPRASVIRQFTFFPIEPAEMTLNVSGITRHVQIFKFNQYGIRGIVFRDLSSISPENPSGRFVVFDLLNTHNQPSFQFFGMDSHHYPNSVSMQPLFFDTRPFPEVQNYYLKVFLNDLLDLGLRDQIQAGLVNDLSSLLERGRSMAAGLFPEGYLQNVDPLSSPRRNVQDWMLEYVPFFYRANDHLRVSLPATTIHGTNASVVIIADLMGNRIERVFVQVPGEETGVGILDLLPIPRMRVGGPRLKGFVGGLYGADYEFTTLGAAERQDLTRRMWERIERGEEVFPEWYGEDNVSRFEIDPGVYVDFVTYHVGLPELAEAIRETAIRAFQELLNGLNPENRKRFVAFVKEHFNRHIITGDDQIKGVPELTGGVTDGLVLPPQVLGATFLLPPYRGLIISRVRQTDVLGALFNPNALSAAVLGSAAQAINEFFYVLTHEGVHGFHITSFTPRQNLDAYRLYLTAIRNRLFRGSYAATNYLEYLAENVSVYSGAFVGAGIQRGDHFPRTRADLVNYHALTASFIASIFRSYLNGNYDYYDLMGNYDYPDMMPNIYRIETMRNLLEVSLNEGTGDDEFTVVVDSTQPMKGRTMTEDHGQTYATFKIFLNRTYITSLIGRSNPDYIGSEEAGAEFIVSNLENTRSVHLFRGIVIHQNEQKLAWVFEIRSDGTQADLYDLDTDFLRAKGYGDILAFIFNLAVKPVIIPEPVISMPDEHEVLEPEILQPTVPGSGTSKPAEPTIQERILFVFFPESGREEVIRFNSGSQVYAPQTNGVISNQSMVPPIILPSERPEISSGGSISDVDLASQLLTTLFPSLKGKISNQDQTVKDHVVLRTAEKLSNGQIKITLEKQDRKVMLILDLERMKVLKIGDEDVSELSPEEQMKRLNQLLFGLEQEEILNQEGADAGNDVFLELLSLAALPALMLPAEMFSPNIEKKKASVIDRLFSDLGGKDKPSRAEVRSTGDELLEQLKLHKKYSYLAKKIAGPRQQKRRDALADLGELNRQQVTSILKTPSYGQPTVLLSESEIDGLIQVIAEYQKLKSIQRIISRFKKIVSEIPAAEEKQAAEAFVTLFEQDPQIPSNVDKSGLAIDVDAAVGPAPKDANRLAAFISEDVLRYPDPIIKSLFVHEGKHLINAQLGGRYNQSRLEFSEMLKQKSSQLQNDAFGTIQMDSSILEKTLNVLVSFLENEWPAYQLGDTALLREVQEAGGFETFEKKYMQLEGQDVATQRVNQKIRRILETLKMSLNNQALVDEKKTKTWVFQQFLEMDWTGIDSFNKAYVDFFFMAANFKTQAQLVVFDNVKRKFFVRDYTALLNWIYNQTRSDVSKGLGEQINEEIIQPLLQDEQLDPGMKPYIQELMALEKRFTLKGDLAVIETVVQDEKVIALNFNPELYRSFLEGMKTNPDVKNFVFSTILKEAGILRFNRENPSVIQVYNASRDRLIEFGSSPQAGSVQLSEPSPLYRLIRHFVASWVHIEYASQQYLIAFLNAKNFITEGRFEQLANQTDPILRRYFGFKVGFEKFLLASEKEQKLGFLAGYYQAFTLMEPHRQKILQALALLEPKLDDIEKSKGALLFQPTIPGLEEIFGQRTIKFMDFLMDSNFYAASIDTLLTLRAEVREEQKTDHGRQKTSLTVLSRMGLIAYSSAASLAIGWIAAGALSADEKPKAKPAIEKIKDGLPASFKLSDVENDIEIQVSKDGSNVRYLDGRRGVFIRYYPSQNRYEELEASGESKKEKEVLTPELDKPSEAEWYYAQLIHVMEGVQKIYAEKKNLSPAAKEALARIYQAIRKNLVTSGPYPELFVKIHETVGLLSLFPSPGGGVKMTADDWVDQYAARLKVLDRPAVSEQAKKVNEAHRILLVRARHEFFKDLYLLNKIMKGKRSSPEKIKLFIDSTVTAYQKNPVSRREFGIWDSVLWKEVFPALVNSASRLSSEKKDERLKTLGKLSMLIKKMDVTYEDPRSRAGDAYNQFEQFASLDRAMTIFYLHLVLENAGINLTRELENLRDDINHATTSLKYRLSLSRDLMERYQAFVPLVTPPQYDQSEYGQLYLAVLEPNNKADRKWIADLRSMALRHLTEAYPSLKTKLERRYFDQTITFSLAEFLMDSYPDSSPVYRVLTRLVERATPESLSQLESLRIDLAQIARRWRTFEQSPKSLESLKALYKVIRERRKELQSAPPSRAEVRANFIKDAKVALIRGLKTLIRNLSDEELKNAYKKILQELTDSSLSDQQFFELWFRKAYLDYRLLPARKPDPENDHDIGQITVAPDRLEKIETRISSKGGFHQRGLKGWIQSVRERQLEGQVSLVRVSIGDIFVNEKLIRVLDNWLVESFKDPGVGYYKVPARFVDWLNRTDPVTFYLFEEPSHAALMKLHTKLVQQGLFRLDALRKSKKSINFLRAQQGIQLAHEPNIQDVRALVKRASAIENKISSSGLEAAVRNFLNYSPLPFFARFDASLGEVRAVETVLGMIQRKLRRPPRRAEVRVSDQNPLEKKAVIRPEDTHMEQFRAADGTLAGLPLAAILMHRSLNINVSPLILNWNNDVLTVEVNPEFFNPLFDGKPGEESPFPEIARAIQAVLSGEQGRFKNMLQNPKSLQMIQSFFDNEAIAYFVFNMQHVLYERQFESLRTLIMDYLNDMIAINIEGAAISDEHRQKYVRYALQPKSPQSKIRLLHDTDFSNIPIVIEGQAGSEDVNVFVVEKTGYQFEGGREDMVPEKVLFAKWQGRRFLLYTSRSHTLLSALARTWRNGQGFMHIGGGWLMKSRPENIDDLSPQLSVRLDELVQGVNFVQDNKAVMERLKRLGFIDFVYSKELEHIFSVSSQTELNRLIREWKNRENFQVIIENPQIKEAIAFKERSFGTIGATSYQTSKLNWRSPFVKAGFLGGIVAAILTIGFLVIQKGPKEKVTKPESKPALTKVKPSDQKDEKIRPEPMQKIIDEERAFKEAQKDLTKLKQFIRGYLKREGGYRVLNEGWLSGVAPWYLAPEVKGSRVRVLRSFLEFRREFSRKNLKTLFETTRHFQKIEPEEQKEGLQPEPEKSSRRKELSKPFSARAEVRERERPKLFMELVSIISISASEKKPIDSPEIEKEVAHFVRAEVRHVGLKRFARSLRKVALRQIEEKSTRVDQTSVDQWMVEAIKFLSRHQAKVLSREGKIDPNLTLGFYLNDDDEPLTAESFIKAAFAEGVPNGLSRLIAVGNPKALRPIQMFQDEIKQSHMILTMIRNPDGIKGYGVSVPVLRKDLAEPSSNPEVVYVGVDSTAVKRESWNPILEVGESYSQLVAAIMLLRKKQNLAQVSSSELPALLKETSIQLFPRLKGEKILELKIEGNLKGGLRLSININRSGFMDYIERLANELKARSEVLIAA